MKKMTVALLMTLALSGCDQPKIDGSSDESLRQSIKQVRASLPADQRAAYDEAIVTLVFTPQRYSELQRAGIDGRSVGIGAEVKGELSGKTGEELISYAEGVRKARAERERDQALQEIAELVQKQQAAAASLKQLTAFLVSRSRFYFEKEEYGRDRPIIALSVANNTDKAVSRAYFRGVLASPGREVPWFSDTFNYQIAGGLEPGEKADWQLAPNPFSDWGKINAPADAVFTVTVTRIDDAQGNPVFGDTLFNERDAERLAELKARYPQAK